MKKRSYLHPSTDDTEFAFVTCQCESEAVLKSSAAVDGWNCGFTRPGFLTMNRRRTELPKRSPAEQTGDFDLPSGCFIRAASHSLGNVVDDDADAAARFIVESVLATELVDSQRGPFDALHVWSRDRVKTGKFGFEPGPTLVDQNVGQHLLDQMPRELVRSTSVNPVLALDQRVLDVCLAEPSNMWFGWHTVREVNQGWPGAVQPMDPNLEPVSRAYFKAAEALAWCGFPFSDGDRFAEIGSSPGGACQRLLEMGFHVTGIDPALMDDRIMANPRFTHVRARGGDIPRRDYVGVKWLMVDSNVRPDKTLTTVKNIVNHHSVNIQGVLLTLKLGEYDDAQKIGQWQRALESWGYCHVRIRQLARGKRELCLAAHKG
ncbi:MAG: SAM-dependent methyltransferase [Planctomycetota bacterium]